MKCVTYNVQYGIGLDGGYDIGRIADAVRGAEVIGLQEVTRNNPKNGLRDMVAELRDALPDYFAVFGPNLEVEIGSHADNGRAVDVRLQFGNMVMSKTPILASRNLLLPRRRSIDVLNLQRGAIEALIDTPLGPVRFYSLHLDHRSPDERAQQLDFLMDRVLAYPLEGGAITGAAEFGFAEPPRPEAFMLMGDFNMLPGSREYVGLVGEIDHAMGMPRVACRPVDAAAAASDEPATTWVEPADPHNRDHWKRIDYVFTSAELASRVKGSWVDSRATGSDHLPLWVELA